MLICKTATPEEIQRWTQQIKDLPAQSTLRQEFAQGDLTLTEEDGVVVFRTERGFTFRRGSLEEAVQAECNQLQRDTLCSTFELVLPDAAEKLRTRFQEVYGKRSRQIDTHVTTVDGILCWHFFLRLW